MCKCEQSLSVSQCFYNAFCFVLFCFIFVIGLSTVNDRPTKSVCKQCHILHFLFLFVMSVRILLFHSNIAYFYFYVHSFNLFMQVQHLMCKCEQECKSDVR